MIRSRSWSPGIMPATAERTKMSGGHRSGANDPRADSFERDADQMAFGGSRAAGTSTGAKHEEPVTTPASTYGGGGERLSESTRRFAEGRLGHDFSRVRVHADRAAAVAAQTLGADAFTMGNDIVFGNGRYQPGSSVGRELLLHELAHVIQQREGGPARAGIRLQMRP